MTDSDFREVSAETTSMENNYRLQRPKGLAKQKKYLPWVICGGADFQAQGISFRGWAKQ